MPKIDTLYVPGDEMTSMLNTLWTYPEDMPKIQQNLKNINQSVSHSPTWIQEMLAHLKICIADSTLKTGLFEHEIEN